MAASSIPEKLLDDIIECPICTEVYTDPRVLPCIHTFCLQCIATWGKDKKPGESLACPLCRKAVKVPAGGFNELQKNIFVEKLLDARRASSSSQSAEIKLCEVCDQAATLTVYCADCQQDMCQECAAAHRRIRLTKSHKLVEIGSSHGERVRGQLRVSESFCDKHEDETLKLYCFDCRLVVCTICFAHAHQLHTCRDVKEVAEDMSGKIKLQIDGLSGNVMQSRNMLKKLAAADQECADKVDQTEREIIARADDMKRQIDEVKDSLIQELRSIGRKMKGDKLETLKRDLERQIMLVESFRKYSEKLMEKGTACDIARAASDIQNRAKELMRFNVDELMASVDVDFKFKITFAFPEDSIIDLKDLFGHLDAGDSIRPRPTAAKKNPDTPAPETPGTFPTSVKPVYVMPSTGRKIGGVTSLRTDVFVVRWNNSQQIQVYDVRTMSLKRSLHVPGLDNVYCGLVACDFYNCLYISDFSQSYVHRVELTGTGSSGSVTKWPVGKTPEGLSLTGAHNVLVACNHTNKFQVFTTTGILVQEIVLQSGAGGDIVHAVELSVDEYGVTFQSPKPGYGVVGVDGRVVGRYENFGAGKFKSPRCVAVNRRGFAFVADEERNRIVVLHPRTLSTRELPVDGGLTGPMGLWLDESRDRLYIGEHKGERVVVITGVNGISFEN